MSNNQMVTVAIDIKWGLMRIHVGSPIQRHHHGSSRTLVLFCAFSKLAHQKIIQWSSSWSLHYFKIENRKKSDFILRLIMMCLLKMHLACGILWNCGALQEIWLRPRKKYGSIILNIKIASFIEKFFPRHSPMGNLDCLHITHKNKMLSVYHYLWGNRQKCPESSRIQWHSGPPDLLPSKAERAPAIHIFGSWMFASKKVDAAAAKHFQHVVLIWLRRYIYIYIII